jgi:CheY-like chemotaxis protein
MATQALLLCRDPNVVGVLGPMLNRMGLGAEVCDAHASALDLLATRKFNPIIVDCEEMEASSELLRSLRQSPSTRDCIALGIIGDDRQQHDAFALGANLVLHKPVTVEEAGKILRTARGLISRMRRECMRHVVHTLAYVHLDGLYDTPMLLDISEGGMAIQALEPLEQGRAYAVRFFLPRAIESFEAVAAVAWADSSGRAGLRFLGMPPVGRERLRRWLDEQGIDTQPEVDAPEGDERVQLPLQLAPMALLVLSSVIDLLLVLVGVAAFATIAAVAGVSVTEDISTRVLLLSAVCWLIYRYAFFGALRMTPGAHLAAALADRCLAWNYNRKLQASGAGL